MKKPAKKAVKKTVKNTARTGAQPAAKPAAGRASRPAASKRPAGAGGASEVDAFMASLRHPFKAEVEALRRIIKGADKRLVEQVKWKAPSYAYKIDLGAFNLWEQGKVMFILLFPKGKMIEDPILEGNYDHRRLVTFRDMAEVRKKGPALAKVIKRWMKLVA